MEKTEHQINLEWLRIMKPACYGLALASFGLILQSYFSEKTPIQWPLALYALATTIIPLFVGGSLSDLIMSLDKSKKHGIFWMTEVLTCILAVNIVSLICCLISIDKWLGISVSVGILPAVIIMYKIERKMDLDDQREERALTK